MRRNSPIRQSLLMTLLLSAWIQVPAIKAGEHPSDSGPLPPSVMPVVILQGSNYEMGYQYGQQVGPYLVVRKEANWAAALQGQSREEVLDTLRAYQRYIEKYAPEILQEMKGMSEGARAAGHDISYADVLLLQTGAVRPDPEWIFPEGAETEAPDLGCSSWAAWGRATTDGSLIIGDSQDRPFFHSVAIVAFPEEGNSYLSPAIAGYLAHKPGMNSKGVSIGVTGGFGQRKVDHDYGIPFHCAIQHLMRYADTAAQAKDLLLSWKLAENTNWLIADERGDAYIIEYTSAVKSVRKPGDFAEEDFIYCTNNYFNAQMKAAAAGTRFVEHAGWLNRGTGLTSVPRNRELWTMFTRYQGKMDLDFAKMMWRFTGEPPPDRADQEFLEAYHAGRSTGWNTRICNLLNSSVAIALPKSGNKGVMHICTGPAGQEVYPMGPGGSAQFQISGTHTFYELTLGDSPAKVVSSAWTAAHERIARVHRVMMKLKLTDPGFAALDALFARAKSDYYEGINWNNKAKLAAGNKSLLCYGKAATAFTRSQARSQQVYHALVPPATTPEALGYAPYAETAWDVKENNRKKEEED